MRKKLCGILTVISILVLFTACDNIGNVETTGNDELNKVRVVNFVGEWECEENPLNDPDNYTGYMKLIIDEDGNFRLYDGDTGESLLEGGIAVPENDYLVMSCNTNKNFNPPPTWDTMEIIEQIKYKFKSEGKLYLTYESDETPRSTLIFDKVRE